MNLKSISDQILLQKTKILAREERELLTHILQHLREIDCRKLFSALGFKSLHEYAVKELNYSDDQAARRISAMRLLREIPAIEEKIESGTLTLTHIGMAHTLFRKERLSPEQKLEVLNKIESTSTREAEKILVERHPEVILTPDRTRPVGRGKVEFRFLAEEDLVAKISQVRGLLAHTGHAGDMARLINKICDIAIERLSPALRKGRGALSMTAANTGGAENEKSSPQESLQFPAAPLKQRVTLPASVRQAVWQIAGGRCQSCGSNHALQVDHCRPRALGGSNELANLRLLCRPCNLRAAVEAMGIARLRPHLDSPAAEKRAE